MFVTLTEKALLWTHAWTGSQWTLRSVIWRTAESLTHPQRLKSPHLPSPPGLRALLLLYFCVIFWSSSNIFTGFSFWVAQQSCEKAKAGFFLKKHHYWCFKWGNNRPERLYGCPRPNLIQERAEPSLPSILNLIFFPHYTLYKKKCGSI